MAPTDRTSKLDHSNQAAILQWVVFGVATIVAMAVMRLGPWRDPEDVVGLPLMTGYAERAEQMGLYAFFAATVLIANLVAPLRTRMTPAVWSMGGALSTLLMLSLVAGCHDFNLLPLVLLGGGGAYGAGTIGMLIVRRAMPSWVAWCGGLIVWLFGNPEIRNLLGSDWRWLIASAGLFVSVLVLAALRRDDCRMRCLRNGGLLMTLLALAGGSCLTPFDELSLELCGAICWALGASIRRENRPLFQEAMQSSPWLSFLGLMMLSMTLLFWLPGRWQDAVPRMLAGAGATMACVVLLKEFPIETFREAVVARFTHAQVDWLRLAFLSGILPLVFVRPWLGTLLAGTVAWLWKQPQSPRPHQRSSWMVLWISLAFMATSLRPGLVLDEYHDGYVLACLWEFANGRALYSEVFPLRSFEFYVGLLGRTILPATVEGYLFSFALLKFLPVVGVSLLILVWTRSPQESFAAGMLCATLSRLDPRQGMQVVLVATQLGLLISSRVHWMWTAVPCGIAACVGFDAFVTLSAATGITTFLVPSLRKRCGDVLSEWPLRVRTTAAYLVAAMLPFSLVIGLWQGIGSVLSFWRLLFDYAKHFQAAYGIPVSWDAPGQRFVIVSNLLLLSLFTSTTVFRWKILSPRRQRAWCFLTLAYFLTLHRGLGRSDEQHLRDSIYLTFALGAVGIVEIVRLAERQRIASPWWKSRQVALLLGVLAAWTTKHSSCGPLDLVKYVSSLSPVETFPFSRDKRVVETVGPNETFWAIERPLAHVANQRHGPTRHPLAHCIGSPSEQRRAVNDMRRNPPQLILWPASVAAREQWSLQVPLGWERQQRFAPGLPTADIMIGVDSVASPLRYFMMSQHVLRHYRPAEQSGYLVPAESDFRGLSVIPADLNGSLRCGRLPLNWGESRLPRLGPRVKHSVVLPNAIQRSTIDSEPKVSNWDQSPCWRLAGSIDPREFNYLAIEVTARRAVPDDSTTAVMAILFDTTELRESASEAVFVLLSDSRPHVYLIPIGCSPAWTWRSQIQSMELIVHRGFLLNPPRVTALRVDDTE